MSRGINKVTIIGNCGQDPDTRYFPDGKCVTNITVATSESWKDKQTGETQTRTEWHRIVLHDQGNYKLGEIAGQYLRKGAKIYVEGKLKTRQWEKDGVKHYTTEIIASEMQMLDSREQSEAQQQAAGALNPHGSIGQAQGPASYAPQAKQQSAPMDHFEDEPPF